MSQVPGMPGAVLTEHLEGPARPDAGPGLLRRALGLT